MKKPDFKNGTIYALHMLNILSIPHNMKVSASEHPRLIYTVVALIFFTITIGIFLYSIVLKSAEEIIQDNKNFTQSAASKLILDSNESIEPVWQQYLKGKDRITKADERKADSLLSLSVQGVLNNFHLVEGGFYFDKLDAFIGYGFPTIDAPIPAFGPPPRSYTIIRDQVRQTVHGDSSITKLHRFDPAIFPLTTQPIYLDGEVIGSVWARIHLERKLSPAQSIQSSTFFLTTGGILIILLIIILLFWLRRKRLEEIRKGLSIMKHNPEYRLKEKGGDFGYISRAINDMTETQQLEQKKRKKLEHDLFQKEKMAALGSLVAGTAHEINTPISIIKTRIQIWERKIKNINSNSTQEQIISDESLQIAHKEIDRVSSLIKRLLVFSKPAGNNKQALDLHDLIHKQMNRCKEVFPDKNLSIYFEKNSFSPIIYADKSSIEQVFSNVLKNSVEACYTDPTITIHSIYKTDTNTIEIEIQDNGSGIDPSLKAKIFDPFFTTKHFGSGLGLSICHEIVKAHHGSIRFKDPLETFQNNHQSVQNRNTDSSTMSIGTVCVISFPVMNH